HFEPSHADKETRAAKLLSLVMVAQDMTHVLAKKAFDAFPKFLYAIDFALIHLPLNIRPRCERWNLFVDAIVPGNIGDQIPDYRKCFHRLNCNWLIKRQRIEAGFAGQPRAAVDFR